MKKTLLQGVLLLVSTAAFSQLYVKPNTSTNEDSYVFVDNEILYVEEEINLTHNEFQEETEASIYLRNDGQLIQGDKPTSLNSGNGKLSVLQNGYANAFDYNYWASPVGEAVGSVGNTNFGITHFYEVQDGGVHPTWSQQASYTFNLNGETDPLVISRRWIYTMRAQNNYYNWILIGHNTNLAPGEGFTMKGTGLPAQVGDAHEQLYDFRGRPNDGNISVSVAHDGTDGMSTLAGNPYPSALDLAEFITNNPDIEANIYFWDQNRETNTHYITDYEGGYGTWIPGGGENLPASLGTGSSGTFTVPVFLHYDGSGTSTGATGESGQHYERRFAPIGQGFIIKGDSSLSGTTGTATFTNEMRQYVPEGADNFSQFKNFVTDSNQSNNALQNNNLEAEETSYALPSLRFHTVVNDSYVRDMVLMFSDHATAGEDRGFDGKHPGLAGKDCYWKLEDTNKPYVIQTLPFNSNDSIPFAVKTGSGITEFEVKLVERIDFTGRVYLYDRHRDKYHRLFNGNTAKVKVNGAGELENRFYITFKKQNPADNTLLTDNALASVTVFQNNRMKQLEVYNPEETTLKEAAVYDMTGKLIIHDTNPGTQSRYTFDTGGLSDGVYLVRLTTKDNTTQNHKVTVYNKM